MAYCYDCGKKIRKDRFTVCWRCKDKHDRKRKEEDEELKQMRKELKQKIIKEFKIYSKLRELEKVVKKPFTIEINITVKEETKDFPLALHEVFYFEKLNKKQK